MLFSEVKNLLVGKLNFSIRTSLSQWGSQRARGSTACGHMRNLSYPNRTGSYHFCLCVCVCGGGGGGGGGGGELFLDSIQFA